MEFFIITLSILLTYSLLRQTITAVSNAFCRVKKTRAIKHVQKQKYFKERENRLTTFEVTDEYQKKFYNGDPEYFKFVQNIDDLFKIP